MRLVCLLALVVGCATSGPGDICGQAADHVAACTGEVPEAIGTCDGEAAATLLEQSCDDLASQAGKSDGFLSDLLCLLGFTSSCPVDLPRTLSGQVQKLGSTEPVTEVLHVRAIREGAASEIRGGFTFNGSFAISGLAAARYRVEVALTASSGAFASQNVDLSSTSFVILHVPL